MDAEQAAAGPQSPPGGVVKTSSSIAARPSSSSGKTIGAQLADALTSLDFEQVVKLCPELIEENEQLHNELRRQEEIEKHAARHPVAELDIGDYEAQVDAMLVRLKEGTHDDGAEQQSGEVRVLRLRLDRERQRLQGKLLDKDVASHQLQSSLTQLGALMHRLPTPLQPLGAGTPRRRPGEAGLLMPGAMARMAPRTRREDRFSHDYRPSTLRVTVDVTPSTLACHGHEAMIEVKKSDSAADVKRRLAAAGLSWGPPGMSVQDGVEQARLLLKGMPLKNDVPLTSLGVRDGSHLRLVPAMCRVSLRSRDGFAGSAPRGLVMNPGTRVWHPTEVRAGEVAHSEDLLNRGLSEHLPILSATKRGMEKQFYSTV